MKYNQEYYQKNRTRKIAIQKKYYQKNRQNILSMKRDSYDSKEQHEKYLKDRTNIINRTKKYLIKTKYKYEKTPQRSKISNVKRKTRYFYPLEDKYCELCFAPAQEHHHDTNPIKVDSFLYVCHNCHMNIEREVINNGR